MGKRLLAAEARNRYLGRTSQSDGGRYVQTLEEHLIGTGELAAAFGRGFGAEEAARLIGRLHDLGKYEPQVQEYLRSSIGRPAPPDGTRSHGPDHSTAGAIHVIDRLGPIGRLFAYPIAGHHAGLPDWHPDEQGGGALSKRLEQRSLLDAALRAEIPSEIVDLIAPSLPSVAAAGDLHLFVRMLYSCLVDADSLDAERFDDSSAGERRSGWHSLQVLMDRLDRHLMDLPSTGPIDTLRTDLRMTCARKADSTPGIFSMTIPTGGGKTLTSLDFALRHAIANGQSRVIYAIPYVSIIEQTAEVFRCALGADDAVLEHHSNLDPDDASDRSEAAAENWDAPVIVTTTVQLFESLFASRRRHCRKVHNVANSVIVLDEVQLLPPGFLAAITSALRELTRAYGVSVVMTTATQPALASRVTDDGRFHGLDDVHELIDDPEALWPRLDRVAVAWPKDLDHRWTWPEVADELLAVDQVLCVVNSRADCRELVSLMPADTVHLSALMCPAHRSVVIADMKRQLKSGLTTRVVSTQLIEAGVDVDFPVVYRAMAGLDSIAQSAGRCNREGRLPSGGRVVVFIPPKSAPPGHLRKGEQATRSMLASSDRDELLMPAGFRRYFELLYRLSDLDEAGIVPLLTEGARRGEFPFRRVGRLFQMISEEGAATVLVPFGDGMHLLRELERGGADRKVLRKLQRFGVTIHPRQLDRLVRDGGASEVVPGIHALTDASRYDDRLGLRLDDMPLEGLLA